MIDASTPLPPHFQTHFRKSPVTDPWEPLFSRVHSESVDLLFDVRPAHCNARGFLHGGVLTALCDNAMGLSLGAKLNNAQANIITVNLSLDFLGTAKVGERVLIVPRVLRAGRSIGCCDCLVYSNESIVARANATFSVRVTDKSNSLES